MSATILDGKEFASQLKKQFTDLCVHLKNTAGETPRIVSILVGDDPSAKAYAASQQKTAQMIGIHYELQTLPSTTSAQHLLALIEQLNGYSHVHGIILNKPLPQGLSFKDCVNAFDPQKDIEGVGVANYGKLLLGEECLVPCTAAAALALLQSSQMNLQCKEAVVIGRSEIVGKPMALLLLAQGATVTVCHSHTDKGGKLQDHVHRADIVVAAIGKPHFVKAAWIKEGATVIDVGINSVDGKIVGDVDPAVIHKASFMTPVPGGVGPVTAMMLMRNTLKAFAIQKRITITI